MSCEPFLKKLWPHHSEPTDVYQHQLVSAYTAIFLQTSR